MKKIILIALFLLFISPLIVKNNAYACEADEVEMKNGTCFPIPASETPGTHDTTTCPDGTECTIYKGCYVADCSTGSYWICTNNNHTTYPPPVVFEPPPAEEPPSCLLFSFFCESQPVTTPAVPACGADCTSNPNICEDIVGCNQCLPNPSGQGNTCQDQPTATPVPPTATPTLPPGTTATPVPPTSTPTATPTPTPPPGATATPTPTPQPFSENMCKCDGIDFDPQVFEAGDTLDIIAYGKVEGGDIVNAAVEKMLFSSGKGTDPNNITRDFPYINPVDVSIESSTATKVRYKATWQYKVPNPIDPNYTYKIWYKPECVRKTSFAPTTTNVLAASDTRSVSWWDSVFNFIAQLFGVRTQTAQNNNVTQLQNTSSNITPKPISIGTIGFIKPEIVEEAGTCPYIRFKAQ